MASGELDRLLNQVRKNLLVEDEHIEEIELQLRKGDITESEAIERLYKLDSDPFTLTVEQAKDEWNVLNDIIVETEKVTKKRATSQFLLGLSALPVYILIVLISLLFKWHQLDNATTIVTVLTLCLTAIAGHSFFVLRIHQQASTAAERLSEKRLGILFLRLAMSRGNMVEREKLLEAGTAMFLGHYAPNVAPLTAEDYSAVKQTKK